VAALVPGHVHVPRQRRVRRALPAGRREPADPVSSSNEDEVAPGMVLQDDDHDHECDDAILVDSDDSAAPFRAREVMVEDEDMEP
jgi:hypothetical protein